MILKLSGRIERVNIHYRDKVLSDCINKLNAMRIKKIRNEDLSRYRLDKVTSKNLLNMNVLFSYSPTGNNEHDLTDEYNAGGNEIIFSSNKEKISTSAITCLSIIMQCKERGLVSAVHVSASHVLPDPDYSDLNNMFLYGYANLKHLAKKDPIVAYISGCCLIYDSDVCVNNNPNLLKFLLPELFKRGIKVKRIDMGGHYRRQVLYVKNDRYMIFMAK